MILWPSTFFFVLGFVVLHKRLEILELVVVFTLPADKGADGVLGPAARAGVVSAELVPKHELAAADALVDWHRVSIWMPFASMSVQPGLVRVVLDAPVCCAVVSACWTQVGVQQFLMGPVRTKDCQYATD